MIGAIISYTKLMFLGFEIIFLCLWFSRGRGGEGGGSTGEVGSRIEDFYGFWGVWDNFFGVFGFPEDEVEKAEGPQEK